jgi:hypothetical protein
VIVLLLPGEEAKRIIRTNFGYFVQAGKRFDRRHIYSGERLIVGKLTRREGNRMTNLHAPVAVQANCSRRQFVISLVQTLSVRRTAGEGSHFLQIVSH